MEPQHQSLLSFKQVILGSLILVVGIIMGAVASYSASYQSGFNAAKSIVENSNVGAMYSTPGDVRNLSGVVTAVTENSLTLRVQVTDPFEDPSLADRTVVIGPSTVVLKLVQKDQKTYEDEMAAFSLAMQSSDSPAQEAPKPVAEIPASFADIGSGTPVIVTAVDDIKTTKEFTASEIQIQARAAAL